MRGCLFVLVLAAAVLGSAAWFGSPLLASAAVAAALQNGGYHAASSTVTASADPPPRLLIGRADRIEIVGTDVSFRTFRAASLDLVLTDVDLVGRTAGTISGRISGAEMTTADGTPASADVAIDGSAGAARAAILVDAATVDRVVKATFRHRFGVSVTGTQLVAPDTLRISATGATVEGRLTIDPNGALAISTALGSAPILSLDPSFPLRLTGVGVADGNLRIDGTLDAEALLGGS
jgi:hypothetical protein